MSEPVDLIARCDVNGEPCSNMQNVAGLGIGCLCEVCSTWRTMNAPVLRSAPVLGARTTLDKVMAWLGW
jgi:hypothetical protein